MDYESLQAALYDAISPLTDAVIRVAVAIEAMNARHQGDEEPNHEFEPDYYDLHADNHREMPTQ